MRGSRRAAGPPTGVVCPRCGAVSRDEGSVCRFCWSSLAGAQPVGSRAARDPSREGRHPRRARVAAALVVLALALLTWRACIFQPAPPPIAPSSVAGELLPAADGRARAGGDALGRAALAVLPPADPAVTWSLALPAAPTVPIVADAERLYVAGEDGLLRALAVADGGERWSVRVPGVLDASPALAGDALLVGTRDGRLLALDPATGAERWSAVLGKSVSVDPVVTSGTVFVAANGVILGADLATGAALWRADLSATLATAAPVATTERLVVAAFDRVAVFDRPSGGPRFEWRLAPSHGAVRALVSDGGRVLLSTERSLIAISLDQRRPWWDRVREAWLFFDAIGLAPGVPWQPFEWAATLPRGGAYPALLDGARAVVGTPSGALVAYDVGSGEIAWRTQGERLTAPPRGAPGGVLVARGATVSLVATGTGEVLRTWALPVPAVQDLLSAGGVVIAYGDGRITALGDAAR